MLTLRSLFSVVRLSCLISSRSRLTLFLHHPSNLSSACLHAMLMISSFYFDTMLCLLLGYASPGDRSSSTRLRKHASNSTKKEKRLFVRVPSPKLQPACTRLAYYKQYDVLVVSLFKGAFCIIKDVSVYALTAFSGCYPVTKFQQTHVLLCLVSWCWMSN